MIQPCALFADERYRVLLENRESLNLRVGLHFAFN